MEARKFARQQQHCLLFMAPRTSQCKTGIIVVGHHPPCVYPLSTWHHHMWPNLSGLPLCTCILQAFKYWVCMRTRLIPNCGCSLYCSIECLSLLVVADQSSMLMTACAFDLQFHLFCSCVSAYYVNYTGTDYHFLQFEIPAITTAEVSIFRTSMYLSAGDTIPHWHGAEFEAASDHHDCFQYRHMDSTTIAL